MFTDRLGRHLDEAGQRKAPLEERLANRCLLRRTRNRESALLPAPLREVPLLLDHSDPLLEIRNVARL